MIATKKMDAFGLKALEAVTGKNLVTIYRWRRALLDGVGISDANKRLLMAAMAASPHALEIADFYPPELSSDPAEDERRSPALVEDVRP